MVLFSRRQSNISAQPFFFPLREVIRPDVMEEVIVSCVIKHLSLVDALQSLVNYQYREDHAEEYDLVCKIMAETFKKINAMERQLQVSFYYTVSFLKTNKTHCAHYACLSFFSCFLISLFKKVPG